MALALVLFGSTLAGAIRLGAWEAGRRWGARCRECSISSRRHPLRRRRREGPPGRASYLYLHDAPRRRAQGPL